MTMTTLSRLVAATDFSPPSRHAAERAALVAAKIGASLDLVHVLDVAPLEQLRRLIAEAPPALEEAALARANETMAGLAAELRQRFGAAARAHVLAGSLLPELRRQAEVLRADLIVLGARGESFLRHLLLGSTAVRMLGVARHPMLVVKNAVRGRYRKILVPVDFSPSSLPSLRLAMAISPGAAVVLLHAYDVPFEGKLRFANVNDHVIQNYRMAAHAEALSRMRELSAGCGEAPDALHSLVLHGDAPRQVLEQEQALDADLIVVGKHGQNVFEEFLLGSCTRHVLAESQCDVLVWA